MILHDAQDLLVGDLPQVFDRHEAGRKGWKQHPEAGNELVTSFEVLEFHLIDLLRDRGRVRLFLFVRFDHG